MTIRRTLLAGAGLGALALAATPSFAKPVHHRKAAASSANAQANAALLAQVKALQDQVADLAARLNVQESAQRETVANVNNTQAAANAAAAQASQAQAAAVQAETAASAATTAATKAVPAEVKTQLAGYSKGKWWDSTTISGRMYFNFSNVDASVNGVRATAGGAGNPNYNGTGFNIKRMYLGIDHVFSPIFAANLTMDASNVVGSTGNTNVNVNSAAAPANATALVGKGFFIKKAYLQAKLDPAFIIRLGSADLPWIPFIEAQYGYRHIENTLIDRVSYGTSADWGVHVLGDLAKGLISYQVSVIDGGGYRNVKVTNSVDVEGRVSMNYKGFYAGVGGYSGKRGNDTQGNGLPGNPNALVRHTATREDAAIGYKGKMFNIGGEYFHAKNWNNVNTVAEDETDGYTLFGNVNFAKTWSVFGRYDWIRPTKLTNDNLKDHYYNFGIQWEPVKIVDLALVYKRDNVDNGTLSTTNGTIGGANPAGSLVGGHGDYSEVGLFGQFRF